MNGLFLFSQFIKPVNKGVLMFVRFIQLIKILFIDITIFRIRQVCDAFLFKNENNSLSLYLEKRNKKVTTNNERITYR